jgi:hypothetical protein
LILAGSICSNSALLFQKGTAHWQSAQFYLVLASAGFTGVGAAATIAGSTTVPKVFSTLGGSTGLGAVNATTSTYLANNEAGISAVNAIQGLIQKLPTPGADGDDVNQQILSQANGYANQCVAANPSGSTGGAATTVAAPTFDPAAGQVASGASVKISSSTSGAKICYTTDNSTPAATTPGTCSTGETLTGGSIKVTSAETVKALATKSGLTNSAVASAAYTIGH